MNKQYLVREVAIGHLEAVLNSPPAGYELAAILDGGHLPNCRIVWHLIQTPSESWTDPLDTRPHVYPD